MSQCCIRIPVFPNPQPAVFPPTEPAAAGAESAGGVGQRVRVGRAARQARAPAQATHAADAAQGNTLLYYYTSVLDWPVGLVVRDPDC